MLLKFRAIEEVGRFAKLTHKAEPLTKLSLIFGRNGYGKSTICSILRSASDGKSSHITARRRLGAVGDSRVDSIWASGATIAYSAGKWNGCPGRIHIFDPEYVSKNLHVGDSITRDNKRSLLPVVLGDEGVLLANKVVSLDKEQRELDEKRKEQSRIILARCNGVTANEVSKFCDVEIPENLDEKTKAAAQRLELAKQAIVVKQKANPLLLPIEGLDSAIALLAEGIDGVSYNAAELVVKHLETHNLGDRGRAWLEYGVTHTPEDQCPFCAQGTAGLPLIAAYKTYFSEALKDLNSRVDAISRLLENLSSEHLESFIKVNNSDYAYWMKLCEISPVPAILAEDLALIGAALEKLRALFKTKRQNPLEIVSPEEHTTAIQQAIIQLKAYNKSVADSGLIIDQARTDTADADVPKAEANHAKWLALTEKISNPVKTAVEVFIAAEKRLTDIKSEKASAQTALTTYTAATMTARQAAVNELLSDFGANFRIIDAKTNFVGREPNTEFAIDIGTHKVKAGDKSENEPSFKTVLSTGDKTTLALAFFIAQIEADAGLKDAVVVFDDPFSSQDMDRQFQTTSHIRSICDKAGQIIILSHDPRFLQLIEKNADTAIIRTFQLQCNDFGDGSLQAWSIAGELMSLYVQQSEMIREYATHQKVLKGQTLNGIHQAIRPFMEDYLRLRFPGRFPDQSHIADMANAIKAAGSSDPLAGSVNDLFAINEYTRPNMHGGGTAPVPGELRAHCKKVVAIVGSY